MTPVSLAPFVLAELDAKASTICALDRELRIAWVNRAWHRFAATNGAAWDEAAWGAGTPLLSAVPEVLAPFYEAELRRVQETGVVFEHEYECSSPELERRFRMRVTRCESGALLCIHSLVHEAPHAAGVGFDAATYVGEGGFVRMCSHCRRVRRAADAHAWDWVPAIVAKPPQLTTHGLCELCLAYYYPE